MFGKIVVGIDGSEASESALRIGCDIAKKYSSELYLVHTPEPKTVAFALGAAAGYHAVTTMPSEDEVKEAADKIILSGIKIAKECGHAITETHTNRGNPIEEITNWAEGCGADLIVTGRRGLSNIGALVVGSTSQGISKHAKCAVLTVAADDGES